MEEDISNYSPTVMFRGTPCIWIESISIVEKNVMIHFYDVQFLNKSVK